MTTTNEPAPIMDGAMRMTGDFCTIFQRINEEGDMLRVCTSVLKTDGTRAVGTYIPHRNADGSENGVVAAVTQVDKVIQANAAGAEENASAAEELNAQAAQLQEAIRELSQIVHGTRQKALDGHGEDLEPTPLPAKRSVTVRQVVPVKPAAAVPDRSTTLVVESKGI